VGLPPTLMLASPAHAPAARHRCRLPNQNKIFSPVRAGIFGGKRAIRCRPAPRLDSSLRWFSNGSSHHRHQAITANASPPPRPVRQRQRRASIPAQRQRPGYPHP
jgi:hypothetical protein